MHLFLHPILSALFHTRQLPGQAFGLFFLIPSPHISNRLQSALLRNALKQVPALHLCSTQHSGILNLSEGYILMNKKLRGS